MKERGEKSRIMRSVNPSSALFPLTLLSRDRGGHLCTKVRPQVQVPKGVNGENFPLHINKDQFKLFFVSS